jgi:SAM-dependent methyltransferase
MGQLADKDERQSNLHPYQCIRWVYRHGMALSGRAIDAALGVSTTFAAPRRPWHGFDSTSFDSRPVSWFSFLPAFRTLEIGRDDVFLDLDAGTGRVTICASFFPFRRAIGIEIDPLVHAQARQNAETLRSRHREKIAFVLADARSYAIADDVTIIFMYNPFGGDVFAQVMRNIFASLDRTPRRLRLVYHQPRDWQRLERTGRCRLIGTLRGMRPDGVRAFMLSTRVYEVGPLAAPETSRSGEAAPELAGRRRGRVGHVSASCADPRPR